MIQQETCFGFCCFENDGNNNRTRNANNHITFTLPCNFVNRRYEEVAKKEEEEKDDRV